MQIVASERDIIDALAVTSKDYDNNVVFNRFNKMNIAGTRWAVTLKVKSSRGAGAKLGFPDYRTGNRRRSVAACWHVHRTFFDALPKGTVIKSNMVVVGGEKVVVIAGNYGKYPDPMVGAMMTGYYMYSELCECEE